jgi:hypothetical protein
MADLSKIQPFSFTNPTNAGIFGQSKVAPKPQQPVNPQAPAGGVSGGVPYNSRIQPANLAEVTQGINTDPRNSGLQEGALGDNALYVNGGRAGGRLNLLF